MSGIISNLKWRYACKQFDPSRKLSEDQLNTVVDSLVLTASSYGAQP